MTFTLGRSSLQNLEGVDPRLIAVFSRAIQITTQDFGFTEPQTRTIAYQQSLVDKGVSHTLKSHHIKDPATGLGTAGDAVPWDGNKFCWDWGMIYQVASAVKRAAAELGTEVTWGAVWDRLMSEFPGDSPLECQAAEQAYVVRRRGLGASAFVDGPHFELGRN